MKDTRWISHKDAGASDNATYYFKKSFTLDAVAKSIIEISAQARYKLYVNGNFVCCGPCKGTREKTYFDCVDVTSYLNVGENEIFCEVLQLVADDMQGKMSPIEGVIRVGSMLLCLELTSGDFVLSTDKTWLVAKAPVKHISASSCYSAATRELHDKTIDPVYENAVVVTGISNAEVDHYWWGGTNKCFLHERPIPMLDFSDKTDIVSFDGDFFEAKYLTFGFPTFKVKGKGTVRLYYFECFTEIQGKTNNDRTDRTLDFTKEMYDEFTVDGEATFEPFWFRCFRFIKPEYTGDVTVELVKMTEVNYPMFPRTDYDFGRKDDNALWVLHLQSSQRKTRRSEPTLTKRPVRRSSQEWVSFTLRSSLTDFSVSSR